jgi:hypothetical protein
MANQTYRTNAPSVVAEAVDGEVMVIDLDSGTYYNLCDVAADVWEGLDAGATVDQCVATATERYEAPDGEVDRGVRAFVAALEEAGLIVAEPGRAGAAPPSGGADRRPFVAPRLEPYVELQNLIQLDPILEQDEQGWPLANEGP